MRKLLVFAAAIVVVLIIGGVASRVVIQNQSTSQSNRPVFTSEFTFDSTKTDDLFIVADNAVLTANSHVAADASIVGRSRVTVKGQIDGDLTVMGGDITIGKEAVVNGEASLIGNKITLDGQIDGVLTVVADTLSISPGAQLKGNLDICATHFNNEFSGSVTVRQCAADELAGWQSLRDGSLIREAVAGGGFSLGEFVATGLIALVLSALSGLLVTIFPRPFGYMTQAVRNMPARMARIGCFSQMLIVAVIALLGVLIAVLPPLGLVMLPILALLLLPVGLLFVVGWMTMALLSGDWLLRRFARRSNPPMVTMIAGSLGLFLLWTVVGVLPYGVIGCMLMTAVLGAVGFGAAVKTRMGRRSPTPSYFVQG